MYLYEYSCQPESPRRKITTLSKTVRNTMYVVSVSMSNNENKLLSLLPNT